MSRQNPVRSTRASTSYKPVVEPALPTNNVFTVEKVLNKRYGRNGAEEFYIKWQGFPESDNSWEPRENLRCSRMIEEYERDHQKRSTRKRKNYTPPPRTPSPTPVNRPATTEQWEDKQLKLIIGLTKAPGDLHFLCKFHDESILLVPANELSDRFPTQVIRFYESKLAMQDN